MANPSEGSELNPCARKFRQAAFIYLHVGLLYEFAVFALWRAGHLEDAPGNAAVWLGLGAVIVAVVFWGLYFRQNRWLARVVWAIHGLRLPALFDGAFLREPGVGNLVPPSFFLLAIAVVVVNLWMLARAGWDL